VVSTIPRRLVQGNLMSDDVNRPEMLSTARDVQGILQAQRTRALDSMQGAVLKGRVDDLQANSQNAALDNPFEDRMKALNAELDGALRHGVPEHIRSDNGAEMRADRVRKRKLDRDWIEFGAWRVLRRGH
jgi:hypothetical protein